MGEEEIWHRQEALRYLTHAADAQDRDLPDVANRYLGRAGMSFMHSMEPMRDLQFSEDDELIGRFVGRFGGSGNEGKRDSEIDRLDGLRESLGNIAVASDAGGTESLASRSRLQRILSGVSRVRFVELVLEKAFTAQ
jgi:hypothetical protein